MNITAKKIGSNQLKIFVNGKINVTTAETFRKEVNRVSAGFGNVVFDFGGVTYVSSAGLREILICRKKFVTMRIENVQREVYLIFDMTGFTNIIRVDRIVDEPKVDRVAVEAKSSEFLNEVVAPEKSNDIRVPFKKFLRDKATYFSDEIAVESDGTRYTWRTVSRCATIIASDLSDMGVKQGNHVAICGANSINWILTFFAIQKLGAIAVLVNFNLCAQEISSLIDYTDVTHFCYGEMPAPIDEVKKICGDKVKFCSIQRDNDFRTRTTEYKSVQHKIYQTVYADDPAVMIFTSGTTGKLKGVLLSSYNILNAANVNYRDQTLTVDDKTCLILPFFHIFGLVAGLFANALAGSTIYLPKDIRTNTILELVSRERCTIFHSVPTMLLALINNKNFSADKISSIRFTIISGAAATVAQLEKFRRVMPNNHFLSSYGLSEMAPVSITDYDDSAENILHTVGKPVKNVNVKIVDRETGANCEVGQVGEILVQGFNLMTAYYKLDADEQPIDADGFLHTGDLGSLDANGYLHLTGRIKELIIRGGENVYPAEIERALTEYDFVTDAKVVGVPDDFFGEVVCACLKLKAGVQFDENFLRESLARRLAKYKIPAYFMVCESFPLLGNGKINVAALKQLATEKFSRR